MTARTELTTTALSVSLCTVFCTLFASSVFAQGSSSESDPFSFYSEQDTRPLSTRIETDYKGSFDFGLGYVGADSFMFGQYNGLYEKGAFLNGDVDLSGWSPTGDAGDVLDYWRVWGKDLGLSVRQGFFEIGKRDDFDFAFGFDNQRQVGNDSGRTPYVGVGGTDLTLPGAWDPGNVTSQMTLLDTLATSFEQVLDRDRYYLTFDKQLGATWAIDAGFSTEDKTGTQAMGGALYVDASNGHSAILPRPVDATTSTFDIGGRVNAGKLVGSLTYLYSKFDNHLRELAWDNAYNDVFGAGVDYPGGRGRAALDPDNEMHRLRATGRYVFSRKLSASLDTSFAETKQSDALLPFTINDLGVNTPLPRSDLKGKVETATLDTRVHFKPQRKLSMEAIYHFEERNNTSPRDGYLYVRGDAWAPIDPKFSVYNSPYDRTVNRLTIDGNYRLPKRNKLRLAYAFEEIERRNTAVSKTKEDALSLVFTSGWLRDLQARIEVEYRDRGASSYNWDQSFLGLLDTRLINEIPDNQRYITHPQLSQYHISNREQWLARFDLSYSPAASWGLSLNGRYQDSDFDQTEFGLESEKVTHVTFSGHWTPTQPYSLSAHYSYDRYRSDQAGRAFRGGIEKNAFDTNPPLAQASDPSRDWQVGPEFGTHSFGIDAAWSVIPEKLQMTWTYNYYHSDGEYGFTTYGANDIEGTALPTISSGEHDFRWLASYHHTDQISFDAEYRYYRFVTDDWAYDGVDMDTLAKVLGTGESNPNDVVHYFLVSVEYRLRR